MKETKIVHTEVTTTRQYTVAEIRKALGVPTDAEMRINGGSYDVTPLDDYDVFEVEWKTSMIAGDNSPVTKVG